MTKEQLVEWFPNVFNERASHLNGEYTVGLDPTILPVQHAPRKVAVALKPKIKETLDELLAQEVITLVIRPTEWISSIVAAP